MELTRTSPESGTCHSPEQLVPSCQARKCSGNRFLFSNPYVVSNGDFTHQSSKILLGKLLTVQDEYNRLKHILIYFDFWILLDRNAQSSHGISAAGFVFQTSNSWDYSCGTVLHCQLPWDT